MDEQPFYLVGKFQDLSDIVAEHQTISRKHAIFQFKNTGELYLYDLESTCGSFVNNIQIPSRVYHQLNPFDTVQFGLSTRSYIVRSEKVEEIEENDGEDEKNEELEKLEQLESEEQQGQQLQAQYLDMLKNDPYFQQLMKSHQLKGGPEDQENVRSRGGDDGVAWGMIDEEDVYQNQEDEMALQPDLLRRLPGLNEKQMEQIGQYEEKLSKYRKIEEELLDLTRKQRRDGGLDAQSKEKKENLNEQLLQYSAQLEQAENNVKDGIFREKADKQQEQFEKKQQTFMQMYGDQQDDTFGDDDFYDRTIKHQKLNQQEQAPKYDVGPLNEYNIENNTQNYWYLKQKLEQMYNKRHQLNIEILNMVGNSQSKADEEVDENDDILDSFMQQANEQLLQDNKQQLIIHIKSVNEEIDKQKREFSNHQNQCFFLFILRITGLLQIIKPQDQLIDQTDKDSQSLTKDQFQQSQNQQVDFQTPSNRIKETLESMQKMKRAQEQEELEETEEDIINDAKQKLKRQNQLQERIQKEENLRSERQTSTQSSANSDNSKNNNNQKVYTAPLKPKSRNIREKDIEQDTEIDLTNL